MKKFLSIILGLLVMSSIAGAQLLVPTQSVATTDDALSTAVNPAGLGVNRKAQGYLLGTYNGDFGRNSSLFLSADGLGFGAGWLEEGGSHYQHYILALGSYSGSGFYLGGSYEWFGTVDRSGIFNLGALYRPFPSLSLGLAARQINKPDGIYPQYDIGIALRSFGNRLTLALDASLNKMGDNAYGDSLNPTLLVNLEMVDGIVFRGHYSEDGYGVGLGINFSSAGLGGYSSFSDGSHQGGVSYARFSAERYRTVFKKRPAQFIELKLSGPIFVGKPGFSLFGPKGWTMKSLINRIKQLKEDEAVSGMILKLGPVGVGWGKMQEIRDALTGFREGGKQIICFMEMGGNGQYYLASVCDKIYMEPSGYLNFNGLRVEVTFLKGTLDKLGIKAELEHIGRYKSASDMLTRDSMSVAHREVMNSILDDLFDQFTTQIAESRHFTNEELVEKIDRGPYTAKEAYEAGLVDSLVYEDQLEDLAKRVGGEKVKVVKAKKYFKRKDYVHDWVDPTRDKIAIVYATGLIVPGKSETDPFTGSKTMGSETIAKAIRNARENEGVKAIVFRIDSGGGSGLASDIIWHEVKLTTEGEKKKPFIVSMADVAGSGGYYIACAADTIVAEPGTITGSIGVISGKFDISGLERKIGFHTDIIKRGEHADIYSSSRGFTEEEREKVRKQIREFYEDFIAKVAEGRDTNAVYIDSIGMGRIWTGRQGVGIGLVDTLGGLDLAVEIAKAAAGIPAEKGVDLEIYPRLKKFGIELKIGSMLVRGFTLSPEERLALRIEELRKLYASGQPLLIMPYNIKIE
ncbi:signal peptide peptidase SppA [candidate division KSB1 bacterium]|nr:signal peptide peptidase SppA [candidate division KSB1 bacterium]